MSFLRGNKEITNQIYQKVSPKATVVSFDLLKLRIRDILWLSSRYLTVLFSLPNQGIILPKGWVISV